eukprot:GDKK01058810.1.p1 GENE.GDKK01058810.1~~GDKK01058810.1.p1  ORF type:complete len:161 (+),score=20.32 GDKK01058810.1:82-564(+)
MFRRFTAPQASTFGSRAANLGSGSFAFTAVRRFASGLHRVRTQCQPMGANQHIRTPCRHAVVVETKNNVFYMNLFSELLTFFLAYLFYTRQLGWDLIDLIKKLGIDMSSLGALGISYGRFEINVRMILDYLFACFIMSVLTMVLPIPAPMLFIRARKTYA